MRRPKLLTKNNTGNPVEFRYYITGLSLSTVSKMLHRTDRTVRDWRNGKRPIPGWAISVVRLAHLERELVKDQMGITAEMQRHEKVKRNTVVRLRVAANEEQYMPSAWPDLLIEMQKAKLRSQ